jgi:hypothetical protein
MTKYGLVFGLVSTVHGTPLEIQSIKNVQNALVAFLFGPGYFILASKNARVCLHNSAYDSMYDQLPKVCPAS